MSNVISVVRSGDTAKINFAKGLTRRFECRMCGCVFDATNDNSDDNKAFTTHVAKNGTTYYKSICPDCGCEVTIFDAVREKNLTVI